MRTLARALLVSLAFIAAAITGGGIACAQSSGAVQAVNAFYGWYLGNHGDWTKLSGARAYLEPSLYASLQKLVDEERREQAEMLDFDPFSGAQAEAASYAVGTPTGGASRAAVPVKIRLSGGNGSSLIHVIVVRGSSGWRIDNFLYGGTNDLRHALSAALK